jgi:hypothetical protein
VNLFCCQHSKVINTLNIPLHNLMTSFHSLWAGTSLVRESSSVQVSCFGKLVSHPTVDFRGNARGSELADNLAMNKIS